MGTLQSEHAQKMLQEVGFETGCHNSIIVLNGKRIMTESDAILEIARNLPSAWKLFYMFAAVPKPLRNAMYHFIASHRYSLFGKKDICMVPTKEIRGKFI